MAQELIKTIEQELHIAPLEKIDPNADQAPSAGLSMAQAAVPATLAGIFRASRSAESSRILLNNNKRMWLDLIFGDQREAIVENIAASCGQSQDECARMMESTAGIAMDWFRTEAAEPVTEDSFRDIVSRHRHEILVYLPASLQMGNFLDDSTIDDRTNKMEGPVSNLVHRIEDRFSGAGK